MTVYCKVCGQETKVISNHTNIEIYWCLNCGSLHIFKEYNERVKYSMEVLRPNLINNIVDIAKRAGRNNSYENEG